MRASVSVRASKKINEAKSRRKKGNGRTRQLVRRVRAARMWGDGTEGIREGERLRGREGES